MKKLWKKEVALTASPLTWFFMAFCAMTMIPGYPILVGSFFACMGIFYTFQFSRENNDILYTALLPVKKQDVVRTKYMFCAGVEGIVLAGDILFTALRMTVLKGKGPYLNNPMMNANLAYLGYVLIVFLLFNVLFLGNYFKSAYYIGKPFLLFAAAAFLTIVLGEILWHIPGCSFLNDTEGSGLLMQAGVLAAAILSCVAGTYLSYKKSVKRFDAIDL